MKLFSWIVAVVFPLVLLFSSIHAKGTNDEAYIRSFRRQKIGQFFHATLEELGYDDEQAVRLADMMVEGEKRLSPYLHNPEHPVTGVESFALQLSLFFWGYRIDDEFFLKPHFWHSVMNSVLPVERAMLKGCFLHYRTPTGSAAFVSGCDKPAP